MKGGNGGVGKNLLDAFFIGGTSHAYQGKDEGEGELKHRETGERGTVTGEMEGRNGGSTKMKESRRWWKMVEDGGEEEKVREGGIHPQFRSSFLCFALLLQWVVDNRST